MHIDVVTGAYMGTGSILDEQLVAIRTKLPTGTHTSTCNCINIRENLPAGLETMPRSGPALFVAKQRHRLEGDVKCCVHAKK